MDLHPGLYELLIDRRLRSILDSLNPEQLRAEIQPLDAGESHAALAQHLGKVVARVLAGFPHEGRVKKQVELCNALIRLPAEQDRKLAELGLSQAELGLSEAELVEEGERLLAILQQDRVVGTIRLDRPETPIDVSSLLTSAGMDPSLVSQFRKEIASADRVDILCSYIKWSGIRILEEELVRLTRDRGCPLRVINTFYTGFTSNGSFLWGRFCGTMEQWRR